MNILLIGRGKMGAALSEAAKERGWQITQVGGKDLARLKTLPPFDGAADFSHPQMTGAVCQFVRRTKTPLCCGPAQLKELRSLGKTAPVLLCANFSTGIHLLHRWLSLAENTLSGWEKAVVESHHAQKKDAPSGTAKDLAQRLSLDEGSVFSLRGGDDPGTHRIFLLGPGEEICLTHRVHSRRVFAEGALNALQTLSALPPGLYRPDQILLGEEPCHDSP